MARRPAMPEHSFTKDEMLQFTSIIRTRIGVTATPGVTNLDVEKLLVDMVKVASKDSASSRKFHEALVKDTQTTVNKFVDRERAEDHTEDRRRVLRKPPATYCITTAQPSHIEEHAHRYGMKPINNGRS